MFGFSHMKNYINLKKAGKNKTDSTGSPSVVNKPVSTQPKQSVWALARGLTIKSSGKVASASSTSNSTAQETNLSPAVAGTAKSGKLVGVSHYGMLVNSAWDYKRHINTLQSYGMTCHRVFGLHQRARVENGGGNLPWSTVSGGKFDLTKLNEAYFSRLSGILNAAANAGIITIISALEFCGYEEGATRWAINPFNKNNNVNGFGATGKNGESYISSADHMSKCAPYLQRLVQVCSSYAGFVILEGCNEPGNAGWEKGVIDTLKSYGWKGRTMSQSGASEYRGRHGDTKKMSIGSNVIASNDGIEYNGNSIREQAQAALSKGAAGYEFWDKKMNREWVWRLDAFEQMKGL